MNTHKRIIAILLFTFFLSNDNANSTCIMGTDRRNGNPVAKGAVTCELSNFVQTYIQYWQRCDQNGNWFDISQGTSSQLVVPGPQCKKCVGSTTINNDNGTCSDPCLKNTYCSEGTCRGDKVISPINPDCP